MKRMNSYENLDVYNEKEVVCVDNEMATMYFAPNQEWTKSAVKELVEDKVFLCDFLAMKILNDNANVVLGYEDDGCLSFPKTEKGVSPEYENQFLKSDIQSMINLGRKVQCEMNN